MFVLVELSSNLSFSELIIKWGLQTKLLLLQKGSGDNL